MTTNPRALILGGTGQVGIELVRALALRGWALDCPSRTELDLIRRDDILAVLAARKPQAIINAAGYTAVDQAETEPDAAFALNRDAPAALAEAAAKHGAALVHISTDYVFNGEKGAPYLETDAVNPLGVYGRSKADGERLVLSAGANAAVVRTSWVYSPHRSNFIRTMLRLGETRSEVSVVADQIGRPTAANDLAAACVALAEKLMARNAGAAGIVHYAGADEATWADLAEFVFTEAVIYGRTPVHVRRITTAEYPTLAQRPANSSLDTTRAEALGLTPRPWREAVRECLGELLGR